MKVVCIGDSLTAGYGIAKTARWSNLLSRDLNIEVINSGISGDTTAGMLARFQRMVIDYNPTHVIISGGTNDLLLNIPDNQIIANMLAMTRYAQHHGLSPVIGLPTPFFCPNPAVALSPFIDSAAFTERLAVYLNILQQFFREENRNIIDFSRQMKRELFLSDGLHPNEEGHVLMKDSAKAVLSFMSP